MQKIYSIVNLAVLCVLSLSLSFSSCKKDEEFNSVLIPGEYTGIMAYYTSINGGIVGTYIDSLSKYPEYKTTISKSGLNYILSFDKSFIYTLPDITVQITSIESSQQAIIKTLEGQVYSSSSIPASEYPPNYFYITKYPARIDCILTLKSNDPDSIYFLNFRLFRLY